jgi:hypothetical protein
VPANVIAKPVAKRFIILLDAADGILLQNFAIDRTAAIAQKRSIPEQACAALREKELSEKSARVESRLLKRDKEASATFVPPYAALFGEVRGANVQI